MASDDKKNIPTEPLVRGVAGILVRQRKLLVIKRDGNPRIPHPNQYALPAGRMGNHRTLYEAADAMVERVFGWSPAEVQVRYIGSSCTVAGYFYGEVLTDQEPMLEPGEGAEIHLFDGDRLRRELKIRGVGNEPGQFVPLFERRLEVILALMDGSQVPHSKLIRS